MKLGISTLIFEDDKLSEKYLYLIKKTGVQLFEILGKDGHFNCENREQIDTIYKSMKRYDLKLSSLHSSLDLLDGKFGEMTQEHIKREIDVLAVLEGRILVIHPCELANPDDMFRRGGKKLPVHLSWLRDIQNGDEGAERIKKRLAALVHYADKKGVRIAIENCDMHNLEFALSIARSQSEIEFVRDKTRELHTISFVKRWMDFLEQKELLHAGICFDTGHANLLDALGMLRIMIHRVITTHIHDNCGFQDEHRLPFQGNIDWKRLMSIFKEADCQCPFIYEIGTLGIEDKCSRLNETVLNLSRFQALWNKSILQS